VGVQGPGFLLRTSVWYQGGGETDLKYETLGFKCRQDNRGEVDRKCGTSSSSTGLPNLFLNGEKKAFAILTSIPRRERVDRGKNEWSAGDGRFPNKHATRKDHVQTPAMSQQGPW